MRHLAFSAVGRDRVGIVAAVAGVLARQGLNIEDAQMTNLRGNFTMVFVMSGPDSLDGGDRRDRAPEGGGLQRAAPARGYRGGE